ncbi:RHS repeat-associated core domain-containing protein [Saccharospirillum impatiens]|uniref:RHS repeat-associated core domain-containing protein n=1 Tax=Saccharospirillum impatiens TaxID=169438 RepID=UPI000422B1AD|nr:RHS repeat-associated core domain-containing protein [Saccharospirillum impatiens]
MQETGFDGRTLAYRYNAAGHLIGQQDGPIESQFERDALGQLIREHHRHPDRPDADTWAEYQYDALGRLAVARNPDASHRFEYDLQGRLIEDEITQQFAGWMGAPQPYQHSQHYRYGTDGRLQRIDHSALRKQPPGQRWAALHTDYYAPGWSEHYQWTPKGQLSRLQLATAQGQNTQPQEVLSQHYNPLGQLIERQQGQHQSQWQYDPEGRLSSYQRQHSNPNDPAAQTLEARDYQYDALGRIRQIQDQNRGTRHYQYDALDRLTQADNQPIHQDPAGNLLSEGMTALPDNRLPFHGDRHFSYDEHGNPVRIQRGKNKQQEQRLSYNAKHQLTSVETLRSGELKQRVQFRYDALGRRIDKQVFLPDADQSSNDGHNPLKHSHSEAYIWQGQTLKQVRSLNQNAKAQNHRIYQYLPGSHIPVALWDEALGLHHIDTDHAGTPKAMYSHETGEEVWSTDHETYGKTRDAEAAITHPVTGQTFEPGLRFQGQYEDVETGLYQNLHRYYDPGAGRYINQDPIGLSGGLNAYQYCPNPVGWADQIGLTSKECNDPNSFQIPRAPIDYDGHIFNAEVKSSGKVVGGHSTATGQVRVITGTQSSPNAQGVYSARIEVVDPANPDQFLSKTNNGGISTMFPDAWDAERLKREVDFAYFNRTVIGNKWTGTTQSGVRVEGYLQPKATVYPKI